MVSGLWRSRWFISGHQRASLSLSSVPQDSAQRRACLGQGDLLCPRLFLLEDTCAPGLAAAPRFHGSHGLHVRHPVPTVPSACPCVSFRAQVPHTRCRLSREHSPATPCEASGVWTELAVGSLCTPPDGQSGFESGLCL